MYEHYFGLQESPFGLTPDTRFFVPASSHAQAFETLRVTLQNREGFIKLTGEVGTGKTLLCRCLLNDLSAHWVTTYIHNPNFSPAGLYRSILDDLGETVKGIQSSHRLLQRLNAVLLSLALADKRVVVLIDEAQAMPDETLEALRLLTNLETESRKLLQVILLGQPELDRKLDQPHLRQLRQRIAFSQRLLPLGLDDVRGYIEHRLRVAGCQTSGLFTPAAIRALHRSSRGVPRLVNILAHKALLVAFGKGASSIEARFIMRAAEDTESARRLPLVWGLLAGWG